jgi:hypothetical protein
MTTAPAPGPARAPRHLHRHRHPHPPLWPRHLQRRRHRPVDRAVHLPPPAPHRSRPEVNHPVPGPSALANSVRISRLTSGASPASEAPYAPDSLKHYWHEGISLHKLLSRVIPSCQCGSLFEDAGRAGGGTDGDSGAVSPGWSSRCWRGPAEQPLACLYPASGGRWSSWRASAVTAPGSSTSAGCEIPRMATWTMSQIPVETTTGGACLLTGLKLS